jgi:hypothetical protein
MRRDTMGKERRAGSANTDVEQVGNSGVNRELEGNYPASLEQHWRSKRWLF